MGNIKSILFRLSEEEYNFIKNKYFNNEDFDSNKIKNLLLDGKYDFIRVTIYEYLKTLKIGDIFTIKDIPFKVDITKSLSITIGRELSKMTNIERIGEYTSGRRAKYKKIK